jgi:hypothetical protein
MKIIPFERSYWVIPGRLLAGEIAAAISKEKHLIKLDLWLNVVLKPLST